MSDLSFSIEFDHVTKYFILEHSRPKSFVEALGGMFQQRVKQQEKFWLLRDVSFGIEKGETVGIIGSNGVGKSTLLKLAAHIVQPTFGKVNISGRVGALLELGAGFHPDLTGRENVYLNGSILGLSRSYVTRQFDNILAFSELDRFIDIPVKQYSSGMYLRLAFAVAVHLEPDILLVDEVLAVGDEAFQHKCVERIRQMQHAGVSILLVSHSMEQIREICERVIWIHNGKIAAMGEPEKIIDDYLVTSAAEEQAARTAGLLMKRTGATVEEQHLRRWGNGEILITGVRLIGSNGRPASVFQSGLGMRIEFDYEVQMSTEGIPAFGIGIYRMDGVLCYGTNTALDDIAFPVPVVPKSGTVSVELPDLQLLTGDYTLDVAVHDRTLMIVYDYLKSILHFSVRNPRMDQGVFRPVVQWSFAF